MSKSRTKFLGLLGAAWFVAAFNSAATGTQDRTIPTLAQIVENSEIIIVGEVTGVAEAYLEGTATMPVKTVQVHQAVKGDLNLKRVVVVDSSTSQLNIGDVRLILIMKRRIPKVSISGSLVPAALIGWTRPVKDGIVGPLEITGEEEYQKLGRLVSKIRSLMRRAE